MARFETELADDLMTLDAMACMRIQRGPRDEEKELQLECMTGCLICGHWQDQPLASRMQGRVRLLMGDMVDWGAENQKSGPPKASTVSISRQISCPLRMN